MIQTQYRLTTIMWTKSLNHSTVEIKLILFQIMFILTMNNITPLYKIRQTILNRHKIIILPNY